MGGGLRVAQIKQRLIDLASYGEKAFTPSPDARDLALSAEQWAEQAVPRARRAASRCRQAYCSAALAHDRAAWLYERLEAEGFGAPDENRLHAAHHREMAAADRQAAQDMEEAD
nr:hypothetical protein GCM10020093_119960 [Planobispora longispora]